MTKRAEKHPDRVVGSPGGRWSLEAVGFATGVTGLVVMATIGVSIMVAALIGAYPAGVLLGVGLVSTAWVVPLSNRWMAERGRRGATAASPRTRVCRRGGGSGEQPPALVSHPPTVSRRRTRTSRGWHHA